MRKLNFKNKIFIWSLLALTLIVFIVISIFIINRFKQMNIKYYIAKDSIVLNSDKEVIKVKNKSYIKKNLLNNYFLIQNDKKINLYPSPVIYNEKSKNIILLGTFYEVKENGKINKLTDKNEFSSSLVTKIFKISDRRYLIISPLIESDDHSFNTSNYLLIDLDKAGNAYLYNNIINLKTFSDLVIKTNDFKFSVNDETLIINNEEISLAKINGTTNKYKKKNKNKKQETSEKKEGNNAGAKDVPAAEEIYQLESHKVKVSKVIDERYAGYKTSILDVIPSETEIKISYVVYDPYNEYRNIYLEYINRKTGVISEKIPISMSDTSVKLSGLEIDTDYMINFYYTYNENGNESNPILFDTVSAKTENIKGEISVVKISKNVLQYKVKIPGITLDSAKINISVNGVNTQSDINTQSASSGYTGQASVNLNKGDLVILSLTDCKFNGYNVAINATYKFIV